MPPSFWAWRVVRRIQMRHAGSTRITMKEASAAWSRVRVRVRVRLRVRVRVRVSR